MVENWARLRKGLALAGSASPRYVTGVDQTTRTVTVGPREALLVDAVRIHSVVWADGPVEGSVEVQTSAHGKPVVATIEAHEEHGDPETKPVADDELTIRWSSPQRRVAPGQSVVLYEGDEVVGGGIAMATN